ncbi:MAG: hypothetical protein ACI8Q1_003632, partial [Parvicella sp.]
FKDLIITPIYFFLLSLTAYVIRPYVTTPQTRRFFLPALWVKFAGAILMGLLYQFWYGGGDTFNYFTHGSRWIWEAFNADFMTGLQLLFESGGPDRQPETFQYSQHIWYYRDPNSFFVVRIVAFFDLLTFHTYSATALFFAAFSFSGMWAFFSAVAKKYPANLRLLAIAILFVPSVAFWGSGILKDTITLGALGWLTYAMIHIIDLRDRGVAYWLTAVFAALLILNIKIYILICYLPTLVIWVYWKQIRAVRSTVIRILVAPILLLFFGLIGFSVLNQVSSQTDKYSLDAIAEQAAITSYDIRYGWGARTGGDGGYDLGVLDGSWQSMFRLMPAAVNVSLFRPYIWEVRNPLMLLSALESLALVILTLWGGLFRSNYQKIFQDPFLIFCLVFSLLFAFAVGVSTFNFGTLMRYKIPMLSFYLVSLSNIK